MSKIFLITGVMAAGKSTIAELLAQKFEKSVHLRGDIFRKMIVKGRSEMSSEMTKEALSQLDMRYKLTANAAKLYYEEGFNVIIQDNYLGEKLGYMQKLLGFADINIVVLNPEVETIKIREQERNKTGYVGFTVEDLHKDFIDTTPKIGFWIDTSELSAEESVAKIIDHYK